MEQIRQSRLPDSSREVLLQKVWQRVLKLSLVPLAVEELLKKFVV
jgi:hypothetical protein